MVHYHVEEYVCCFYKVGFSIQVDHITIFTMFSMEGMSASFKFLFKSF
jgi:hypothetical protein